MDINNAARDLVDNVSLSPDVDIKLAVAVDHLTNAYNKGHDNGAATQRQPITWSGMADSAELWAENTLHKVTSFGEPVQFAIRYYHKVDGALREVLASSEQAVLAELHVLLLKDDATGVSVVRVNRG